MTTRRRPTFAERLARHATIVGVAEDAGCTAEWLSEAAMSAVAAVGRDCMMNAPFNVGGVTDTSSVDADGDEARMAQEIADRLVAFARGRTPVPAILDDYSNEELLEELLQRTRVAGWKRG